MKNKIFIGIILGLLSNQAAFSNQADALQAELEKLCSNPNAALRCAFAFRTRDLPKISDAEERAKAMAVLQQFASSLRRVESPIVVSPSVTLNQTQPQILEPQSQILENQPQKPIFSKIPQEINLPKNGIDSDEEDESEESQEFNRKFVNPEPIAPKSGNRFFNKKLLYTLGATGLAALAYKLNQDLQTQESDGNLVASNPYLQTLASLPLAAGAFIGNLSKNWQSNAYNTSSNVPNFNNTTLTVQEGPLTDAPTAMIDPSIGLNETMVNGLNETVVNDPNSQIINDINNINELPTEINQNPDEVVEFYQEKPSWTDQAMGGIKNFFKKWMPSVQKKDSNADINLDFNNTRQAILQRYASSHDPDSLDTHVNNITDDLNRFLGAVQNYKKNARDEGAEVAAKDSLKDLLGEITTLSDARDHQPVAKIQKLEDLYNKAKNQLENVIRIQKLKDDLKKPQGFFSSAIYKSERLEQATVKSYSAIVNNAVKNAQTPPTPAEVKEIKRLVDELKNLKENFAETEQIRAASEGLPSDLPPSEHFLEMSQIIDQNIRSLEKIIAS